jgi:threonine/homoserine/homoserine lactone efflux protein
LILTLTYQTIIIVALLSFSFGPAFFALINTGIKYGYKTGSLLAIGVVLSDFIVCMLVIYLVYYGKTNYIHEEKNKRFMGIIAGVLLIVFGSFHFKKPVRSSDATIDLVKPTTLSMIIKGFFLNSLNPAVYVLWLSNVTIISETLNNSIIKMVLYFSITLGLVLLVEFSKVSAANKLKQLLTERKMYIINIITGSLLGIFGLILIYKHYFDVS